jgi:hypothetical protein
MAIHWSSSFPKSDLDIHMCLLGVSIQADEEW